MFREFFGTIFLCMVVGFLLQAGILILAPLYGWYGVLPFIGVNVAGAYFFNKARRSGRSEAFDDKIGSRRMDAASVDLVGMMLKHRDSNSTDEQ